MKQNLINIIIILIFSFSCTNKEISEKESNDNFNSSMLINIDSTVIGSFNGHLDIDYYKIIVKKPTTLSITINRIKGLDVKIQIYNNRLLIKIVDDYLRNEGEKINNIHFKQGLYFIKASISKPEEKLYKNMKSIQNHKYKLNVKPINNAYEETEPNDLPNQSVNIELEKPIFGYYSPFKNLNDESKLKKLPFDLKDKDHLEKLKLLREYDFDWYSFKIPKPGDHQIIIELENTKLVDSVIGVYQKKPLLFWNSKGMGENETIPNLTVKGDEICYILIVGVNHHSTTSEQLYKYKLSVKVRSKANPSMETENNNSIDKANLITEGFIHGLISPKKDYDYYHLQIKSSITKDSFLSNPFDNYFPPADSEQEKLKKLNEEQKNSYTEELDEIIPLNPEDEQDILNDQNDNPLLKDQDKLKNNPNKTNPLLQDQDKLKNNPNKTNPLLQDQDKLKNNPNKTNPLPQDQDKLKNNPNKTNPLLQNQDKLKNNQNEDGKIPKNKPKKEPSSYFKPISYQLVQNNNLDEPIHKKRKLFISVTGVKGVDIELRLYDSKTKLLNVYDTNGRGKGETIQSYDVSKMKDIYILVKGGRNNSGENNKQPYKLTVKIKDYEYTPNYKEIYEVEPNGETIDIYKSNLNEISQKQKSLPNIIYVNQKVLGFINPKAYYHNNINLKGDVDYYEVNLNSNKKYKVTLIGIKGSRLSLKVFQAKDHRNHKKQIITKGRQKRYAIFSTDYSVSYLDNIYHIKVTSRYGKSANSEKPYTLFIEEVK